MFNKIFKINCEKREYILTMRCHSWTTFSPLPSLSQKAGNNQNHFCFKEERLTVSRVSASLGLFVTTQTHFGNSPDTAFSMEKQRLRARTRELICSQPTTRAYSYASSTTNVAQKALAESEPLAPQRLSVILSTGLCRLWHPMTRCAYDQFIIHTHHISNYTLRAHCPQWYSLALLQVKNYLCSTVPNKPLVTHTDVLFSVFAPIYDQKFILQVTIFIQYHSTVKLWWFFSGILFKNKIFALPWWGSLVLTAMSKCWHEISTFQNYTARVQLRDVRINPR